MAGNDKEGSAAGVILQSVSVVEGQQRADHQCGCRSLSALSTDFNICCLFYDNRQRHGLAGCDSQSAAPTSCRHHLRFATSANHKVQSLCCRAEWKALRYPSPYWSAETPKPSGRFGFPVRTCVLDKYIHRVVTVNRTYKVR